MVLAMAIPEGMFAPDIAVFVFLAIGAISLFTFLSVATYAGTRQDERKSYYKAEMLKKIAEIGGERNAALEYLREEERIGRMRRLGGYKIGGLVNIGVGAGLMLLLHGLVQSVPVYLAGTIPLFVGVALLAYAFWFAPEREA